MKKNYKLLSLKTLAVASAIAGSLGISAQAQTSRDFGINTLGSAHVLRGNLVKVLGKESASEGAKGATGSTGKSGDGKCGEGKCGS